MWVLTEVADWYDKIRKDNETWLANEMDHAGYDFVGALVYTSTGVARLLNSIPGAIGGGFIDVLRLGDGTKEGGWGYGKDVLRLLVVAGPLLRVGRSALSMVLAVDELPGLGNCTWVASSRALRLTGVRHFARVGDLASEMGITIRETEGAWPKELLPGLKGLGADARVVGTASSLQEVASIARGNPNGVVIFCVRFGRSTSYKGGPAFLKDNLHTLLAARVGGAVAVIDRTGKVYANLEALGGLYSAAPELNMTIAAEADIIVINNARIVNIANAISRGSWIANSIALELRSIPSPSFFASAASPIVLKTDSQLIAGWWWVWVDAHFWCYVFDPSGAVHWSDPYNHLSGSGKWKVTQDSVEVVWSPPSATKERWDIPIMTGQQTGNYVSKGQTSQLRAMKIPVQESQKIVGKWNVQVSKWTWVYDFTAYGRVTWRDPLNNQSGQGRWSYTKTSIYLDWSPSKTREEFDLPVNFSNQSGTSWMSGNQIQISAVKASG